VGDDRVKRLGDAERRAVETAYVGPIAGFDEIAGDER